MADARDSKSRVLNGRVGSTPTFGTLLERSQNPGLSGVLAFLAEDGGK